MGGCQITNNLSIKPPIELKFGPVVFLVSRRKAISNKQALIKNDEMGGLLKLFLYIMLVTYESPLF